MNAQLQSFPDVLRFILAGNATFTLVSKATGTRFTYRAKRPDPSPNKTRPTWFSVLSGPDNESNYAFIGTVWPTPEPTTMVVKPSSKSRVQPDAPSAKGLAWFLAHLSHGDLPQQVEFWHEGRCARCGRKLTVPESIERGIGPECAQYV